MQLWRDPVLGGGHGDRFRPVRAVHPGAGGCAHPVPAATAPVGVIMVGVVAFLHPIGIRPGSDRARSLPDAAAAR
jgi:hypothetical protein